ncbi:DUF3800 domain-containing protein [Isoptericola rhizosphaerae]|uniref:DUF3800 domain-containing protein n=1 Tax=Isoptericola rhizosphaerae TaxID=3377837 RepID=UPI00383B94D2
MSVISTFGALQASDRSPSAEFAYIDESGDVGPTTKGGTRTFTLGCVLVPLDQWTDRLGILTEARRDIRRIYGVRLRDELKANYLIRGRGPLSEMRLGDGQRRDIYQRLLRATAVAASGTFAVIIDKEHGRYAGDAHERAWEYLFQRLRMRSRTQRHPIIVVHDDGENAAVRKHHRRFRRHSWAPGGHSVDAPLLVEDPVVRDSALSYFVQSADLAAYAAFRRFQPPGRKVASVCNERMWSELAGIHRIEVSRSNTHGIVVYPT